jgi:Bacteriophage CI repressor helix-turn-helix domain.
MREFDLQLLRLKQCLAVREDQEVAAILGLSKHAFSDRKKRGSFPKDKLLALKVGRPELYIDEHYILTGEPGPESSAAKAIAGALNAVKGRMGDYSVGEPSSGYQMPVDVLIGKIRMLDREDLIAVESVVDAILKNKKVDHGKSN